MLPKSLTVCPFLALAMSLAAAADNPSAPPARVSAAHVADKNVAPRAPLSAVQIVDKNVAARGGLQAWRAVQTMSLEGNLGVGGNQRATLAVSTPVGRSGRRQLDLQNVSQRRAEEVQLPFVMQLERPHKMRFELKFNGQTAIQVFDGTNGWKVRPFLNRDDVEPYTPEEMKTASLQGELDGPLVDYAAKGTRIELAGMEKLDGRDTYKLKLTMSNGQAIHLWIDAETFLETKIEGRPRRLDGTYHPVEVYFRDYRTVSALQIPFVRETRVLPVTRTALGFKDTPVPPERIVIDKVVVNPKLDESRFARPQLLASGVSSGPQAGK